MSMTLYGTIAAIGMGMRNTAIVPTTRMIMGHIPIVIRFRMIVRDQTVPMRKRGSHAKWQ